MSERPAINAGNDEAIPGFHVDSGAGDAIAYDRKVTPLDEMERFPPRCLRRLRRRISCVSPGDQRRQDAAKSSNWQQ
jgi:hypothetical protein